MERRSSGVRDGAQRGPPGAAAVIWAATPVRAGFFWCEVLGLEVRRWQSRPLNTGFQLSPGGYARHPSGIHRECFELPLICCSLCELTPPVSGSPQVRSKGLAQSLHCGPSGYSRRGNRSPRLLLQNRACQFPVHGSRRVWRWLRLPSTVLSRLCIVAVSVQQWPVVLGILARLVLAGGCDRLPAGLVPCSIARIFDLFLVVFAGLLLLVSRRQDVGPFSCSSDIPAPSMGGAALDFSLPLYRCVAVKAAAKPLFFGEKCRVPPSRFPDGAVAHGRACLEACLVSTRVVEEEACALLYCRSFDDRLSRSRYSILL